MSHRDRSNQDRGLDDEPRRDQRRRDVPEIDDESFELPSWGGQQQRTSPRESGTRATGQTSSRPRREPAARSGTGGRDPLPTLGDAFRRRNDAAPDDRSSSSTRDPYDRLRGVASRPQRPIDLDADEFYDEPFEGRYDSEAYDALPPVPRDSRSRRRATPPAQERRPTVPRTPATQQIGGLISAAAPQTRLIAGVGGFALLSLVFMAATVAGRMSSVPDWIPIHLNAEGTPDLWGESSTLWRVPLMALMLTLMSAGTAWYLWKRDPFAARFMIGSTVLIHALSWVALINLVW
ncbi:MAG: hypothetical protein IT336_01420 [Thermomicrobiales bacterium]|nr:hypothetical protein [Thermomicrobiales bacterium]